MYNFYKTFLLLFTILLIVISPFKTSSAISQTPTKTEIEAVFIYKFLNYIEWPVTPGDDKFRICTAGTGDMNSAIDSIEQKEHLGMEIDVVKKVDEEKIQQCKVVYIDEINEQYQNKIIDLSQKYSILTISSKNGFIEAGGMINFIFMDNRVSFEINYRKADKAGLKISSKLLRLAKKVINK